MRTEEDKIYQYLIDNQIATEEEVDLVTTINGYNTEAMNDILYVRTGYRSVDQIEGDD